MAEMDAIDCLILNETQKGLPLESRPFRQIAALAGIEEQEVVIRLKRLKETGIIRRLGGIFDGEKLGLVSTLVGVKAEGDVAAVAEHINQYLGVTHNYQRDHAFNLWFTLTAPSQEEINRILDEIRQETGAREIISLPARRKHKVRVYLPFDDDRTGV